LQVVGYFSLEEKVGFPHNRQRLKKRTIG